MGPRRDSWYLSLRSALRLSWTGKTAGNASWLIFVLFYVVVANIPYWIASRAFGFTDHLGRFCVEFIAVGLVALVAPPIISAMIFLLEIAADLVSGVCRTYFLSVSQCLSNVGVFHDLSGARRGSAIGVVLLALVFAAAASQLPAATVRRNERWRPAACLLAFAFLCGSADLITLARTTRQSPNPLLISRGVDWVDTLYYRVPRLSRMPIVRIWLSEQAEAGRRATEKANLASVHGIPSASATAMKAAGLTLNNGSRDLPNLVIVIVESWGLVKDLPLQEAWVQPYLQPDLRARYEVVEGTVPFSGPTIAGEARELCGSSFAFHILDATADELKGCLPGRLAARGYYDIALHGMSGELFRRSTWYKTIGFEEILFNKEFKQQGLPDCMGALIGTCDAAVAGWIGRRLAEDDSHPYFVHWMTLNSHLPMLVPSALPGGSPCLSSLSIAPDSAMCSWYQLLANVHQSVADLAMRKAGRPTVFVVVGDHAPPFVHPDLLDRFSTSVVPYVLLIPRSNYKTQNRFFAHSSLAPPGTPKKPSAHNP
jgi:hypothetical protein